MLQPTLLKSRAVIAWLESAMIWLHMWHSLHDWNEPYPIALILEHEAILVVREAMLMESIVTT